MNKIDIYIVVKMLNVTFVLGSRDKRERQREREK
jgi:hypothetical protein